MIQCYFRRVTWIRSELDNRMGACPMNQTVLKSLGIKMGKGRFILVKLPSNRINRIPVKYTDVHGFISHGKILVKKNSSENY